MALIDQSSKPYAFSAVSKDIVSISQRIIEDEELCKLLYYNSETPSKEKNLTAEEKIILLEEEYVQIIPRIKENEENSVRNFIVISYSNFQPNSTNTKYMDGVITIDILSNLDCWKIKNGRTTELELRPHAIAQRLYDMLHEKKLCGIGKTHFEGGSDLILGSNPNYAGLTIHFSVVNSNS